MPALYARASPLYPYFMRKATGRPAGSRRLNPEKMEVLL